MLKQIVVLVNGTENSAAGVRARGLWEPLKNNFRVEYFYRDCGKIGSLRRFLQGVRARIPNLVYVVDTAVSGAGAAILARALHGVPFIIDTGDLGYELAELTATPGWAGRKIIGVVEATALRLAAAIVVRGTYHKQILNEAGKRCVFVIRDGIHKGQSRPLDVSDLRREWGWNDDLCVGMMGSIKWSSRTGMCYGWDLIEAIGLLDPALPVRALIIGDGDGLPRLQARAQELGLGERIRFTGRVPYDQIPLCTSMMDVALSTQTNNRVGQVRTTGKLPEYMAAGCYVLATDVGEARLLLPLEMRLPYEGVKDTGYPARLAEKITALATAGRAEVRRRSQDLVTCAHADLEYGYLSAQLRDILQSSFSPMKISKGSEQCVY